ncbi:GNAT family N-acetyltransferase [Sphingomonas sp. PAMC 26605]|uniref:GNAT family N-acetyltransferase n=1 Tax=Sphingomonas sp. PAMC 26605 TaxID=1112214 RepID=UPI00026CA6FF|nr:GNAT family N-acetyltransferase [Sphingomonas sp. PAMC 26605]
MTKPMLLSDFTRLPSRTRASVGAGLSGAIDLVADAAAPSHAFLRYGWYAAALAAYGGAARTILVEEDDLPVIALPFVRIGPAIARLASVPGSYWPFRSFPIHRHADLPAIDSLLDILARSVTALRIGPVSDGDPALDALLPRARAKGWAVLDRFVANSFVLDLQQPDWPRGSTLRKNRFHEKHLAEHGALDWEFVAAGAWDTAFDRFAAVEQKSWIAAKTDGRDAKFTREGHGAFWREAARDPILAQMLSAAVLSVDGAPAAFSFDLDVGTTRYAIANSYDPAFAKHSPGKLLAYRNLGRARAAGVRSVDWGAGDSGYKTTLGAAQGPAIRDWLLVRPGVPALFGALLKRRWAASGNPLN